MFEIDDWVCLIMMNKFEGKYYSYDDFDYVMQAYLLIIA